MIISGYQCSDIEIREMKRHGVRPEEIRVAQPWQQTSTYGDQMKAAGQRMSVNCLPCKNCSYTTRTRRGHCTNCHPQSFAHENRHGADGWVYLAVSKKHGKAKVGVTDNIDRRQSSLTDQAYAGCSDWLIVRKHLCKTDAGRLEDRLIKEIGRGKSPSGEAYRGDVNYSREAFNVDPFEAVKRWDETLRRLGK
jgi:hypothetical protein